MKIAIIGTHSTGKTTLLNILKATLESMNLTTAVVPELSRLCPFPINEETTLEAQQWIQANQIQRENELHQPKQILLCDRATLDNFAYFQRAGRLRQLDVTPWEQAAARHMSTYRFIFKTCKLALPPAPDGLRAIDVGFRDEIDDSIHQLLDKHNVKYHLLSPSANYNVHLHTILNLLQPALASLI